MLVPIDLAVYQKPTRINADRHSCLILYRYTDEIKWIEIIPDQLYLASLPNESNSRWLLHAYDVSTDCFRSFVMDEVVAWSSW